MDSIRLAVQNAGGPSKVARLLGCSVQAVCFYREGKRAMPVEFVTPLSEASRVPRWVLRPADWHLIWPELIGAEGAPKLPKTEA